MRRLCTLTALTILVANSWCADAPSKSGPQVGQELPGPFQPFNATGKRKGTFHCLVCEHGLNPTVMVFAPATEPGAPFLKLLGELDKSVEKNPRSRLGAFAVFLSDDVKADDPREALAAKAADWAKQAKLRDEGVVLAIDKTAGPDGYKLAEGHTTVVVYNRLTVVANLDFEKALTDADVESVLKAVDKLVPARR
jgi:hypothetical protein